MSRQVNHLVRLQFAVWYERKRSDNVRLSRTTYVVADEAETLITVSRQLHSLAEIACERSWTDAEVKRDARLILQAKDLVRITLPRYKVAVVSDPRAGCGLVLCGPGETYHGDGRGYRVPRLVVYLTHFDRCVRYQDPHP